jgi:protein-L-isoaspartate(D-aspartate) O-methyltransferase
MANVIIVHAGVTHPHPLWLDSLHPGGRLIVPLTDANRQGRLFKITRVNHGYRAEAMGRIEIFPCQARKEGDIDGHLLSFWETMSRMGSFLLPADDVPGIHTGNKSKRKYRPGAAV